MSAYRYTRDNMVSELRRVAAIVDGPLSRPKYERHGRIDKSTISNRFGGWLAAIGAAGLEPAFKFGGMWFDCPICGQKFRSSNSPKARRTCSPACGKESKRRKLDKGRAASPQATRGRARRLVEVRECRRCGHGGERHRLEVHHIDGDPYNNAPENLEVLCLRCHRRHHDRVNGGRNRKSRNGPSRNKGAFLARSEDDFLAWHGRRT